MIGMDSMDEAVVMSGVMAMVAMVAVVVVVMEAKQGDKTGSLRTILTSIAGTVRKLGMIFTIAEHMQEINKRAIRKRGRKRNTMMTTRTLVLVLVPVLVLELLLGQNINQVLFLLINTQLI